MTKRNFSALTQESQGQLIVLGQAILWGLFPIITILSLHTLPPLVSLSGSTFFAAIFFAVVLTFKKKWQEVKSFQALKDILLATLFSGILYYAIIFFGLQQTSAGNASIIALSEVFFSYLIFNLWKKDDFPLRHFLGAFFIIVSVLIVLLPQAQSLHFGDLFILTAAATAPFGNYFAKRARTKVSTESILFIRSAVTSIVIGTTALIFQPISAMSNISFTTLFFLLINGIVLFGIVKLMWVEGIHRISVTLANALASISPLLTLLFAWIILKNTPTIWQLFAFVPMFIGILLLGGNKKKKENAEMSAVEST